MRPSSPYFVSAGADVACIGGLSIATALGFWALATFGYPLPGPGLSLALAWVVNWPHFSASSVRLYHSRSNIAQYPVTAIAIPFLILAAVVGTFLAPATAGAAFLKLYLLWSPFHFSGQSLGITLIYARRSGLSPGRLDRAVLGGFFMVSYFRLILGQETIGGVNALAGLVYPLWEIPSWPAQVAGIVELLLGVAVLVGFTLRSRAAGRALSPIILLPALAQSVWFEAGARMPAFNLLVPLFHSLQYLLIAWAMHLREQTESSPTPTPRRFVLRESLRWAGLNFVGGAALFWILPAAVKACGAPPVPTMAVLYAAVQIHHFFVDGVIWKLRNPRVGSPLLVNLDQLAAAGAAAGGAAA